MKKIIILFIYSLIIILSVSTFGFSQKKTEPYYTAPTMPIDDQTKLITYSKVVQQAGSQSQLYSKAYNWFINYYKNPTSVIKEADSINAKIIGKPRFRIMNPPDKEGKQTIGGIVLYTITVQCKDGRYKYDITNINWDQNSYYPIEKWMDKNSPYYEQQFDFYLIEVDTKIKEIIKALEDAMKKEQAPKNDNW